MVVPGAVPDGGWVIPAASSIALTAAAAVRMRAVAALMVVAGRARGSLPAQLESAGKVIVVVSMPMLVAVR